MDKPLASTTIEKGRALYKRCNLYLLVSCIALICILRILFMFCISNMGGISFFDFEEALRGLFPYILGFFTVPIAYRLSNKTFKVSLLLHVFAYLYSFLYIYFAFKGGEWMFYPLTSQPFFINLLQITIGIVYPAYLILCGIQLWKLCTNQDIKFFYKNFKHSKTNAN